MGCVRRSANANRNWSLMPKQQFVSFDNCFSRKYTDFNGKYVYSNLRQIEFQYKRISKVSSFPNLIHGLF